MNHIPGEDNSIPNAGKQGENMNEGNLSMVCNESIKGTKAASKLSGPKVKIITSDQETICVRRSEIEKVAFFSDLLNSSILEEVEGEIHVNQERKIIDAYLSLLRGKMDLEHMSLASLLALHDFLDMICQEEFIPILRKEATERINMLNVIPACKIPWLTKKCAEVIIQHDNLMSLARETTYEEVKPMIDLLTPEYYFFYCSVMWMMEKHIPWDTCKIHEALHIPSEMSERALGTLYMKSDGFLQLMIKCLKDDVRVKCSLVDDVHVLTSADKAAEISIGDMTHSLSSSGFEYMYAPILLRGEEWLLHIPEAKVEGIYPESDAKGSIVLIHRPVHEDFIEGVCERCEQRMNEAREKSEEWLQIFEPEVPGNIESCKRISASKRRYRFNSGSEFLHKKTGKKIGTNQILCGNKCEVWLKFGFMVTKSSSFNHIKIVGLILDGDLKEECDSPEDMIPIPQI